VVGLDQQVNALGLDALRQDGADIGQQAADDDRGFLQGEPAGLDLRDVQDVVNLTVSQASSYVLSPAARTLSEAFDQLKAELVTDCGD
jgi:hypothetical protein